MKSVTLFTITLFTLLFPFPIYSTQPCTDPAQRKEWRALTKAEKKDWIDAFKCLIRLPHDEKLSPSVFPSDIPPVNSSGSYYDDIVYLHMDLNHVIHFTGLFFPWHRWFVHSFELALKEKCGFKGTSPYWDWTIDAPNFYDSSFWKDSDVESGLGGWGDDSQDYSITDGAFSSVIVAYPTPHRIRRQYMAQPFVDYPPLEPDPAKYANTSFTKEEVSKVVNGFVGDYLHMQAYVENFEGMHSAVHNILQGDLKGACPQTSYSRSLYPDCENGPKWSPNDPTFWMHHAMIDKVWYDWQHSRQENFGMFEGGSVQMIQNQTVYDLFPTGGPPSLTYESFMPSDGLWEAATIRDVLDTKGGYLCYVYT